MRRALWLLVLVPALPWVGAPPPGNAEEADVCYERCAEQEEKCLEGCAMLDDPGDCEELCGAETEMCEAGCEAE